MRKLVLATAIFGCFSVNALEQACDASFDRSSPTANFIDNKDGTVTDRSTKLTWMRCSIGQTFNAETSNCDGNPEAVFWQDALKTAEKVRSSEEHSYYQFAGIKNWRLPNIKELNSIRETACIFPAVNNAIFPNILALTDGEGGYSYVWSGTPVAYGSRGEYEQGIMYLDVTTGSLAPTSGITDYQRQVLLVADNQAD